MPFISTLNHTQGLVFSRKIWTQQIFLPQSHSPHALTHLLHVHVNVNKDTTHRGKWWADKRLKLGYKEQERKRRPKKSWSSEARAVPPPQNPLMGLTWWLLPLHHSVSKRGKHTSSNAFRSASCRKQWQPSKLSQIPASPRTTYALQHQPFKTHSALNC